MHDSEVTAAPRVAAASVDPVVEAVDGPDGAQSEAAHHQRARELGRVRPRDVHAGEVFPEPEAAMAKQYGSRLAVDMARDAVQAFGGLGFARELAADGTPGPVEAIYRDSKIGEIYEGANEILKWVIARGIFGKEITG
ncbi:acyl-CoA dehydrogenase family protein [Amycolatopsis thermoflava]|uniref:acyl-CoA dehydrogenase family protein n=2 Tax=Amycolatopsis thermoflava TaxID=84480 RepID=UPI001E59E744|nr:acyl-CoA dehydrogenase family protein [Amycolatopsis thermoflava]